MSDASATSTTSTPPATTTTTQATPPAPNTPEARNPDGSLKDNQGSQTSTTPEKSSTTDDKKPEAGKTEDKKPEDKKAPGAVPEKYEFKAAEGQQVDQKLVDAATPIFKELGLTQDQANKLFEFYNANNSTKALVDTYESVRKDWRGQIVSGDLGDGKEGLKPEVQQNVSAFYGAMDQKSVASLKNALDLTGAGDHPDVVAAMNAVGKLLREGSSVRGNNPSPLGQKQPGTGQKSLASAMFPNLPSSGA
jgi:hypothetical protein